MKPTLVIIGLGNPGKNYDLTRHNVGFRAADKLGEEFGTVDWQPNQKFMADVMEARIITAPVLLVKPVTYMNRSGECAHKIIDFFKLTPSQIFIIADDVDLPVGEIRMRESGGAGSHNGLKSIVEHTGEDFPRIRIGVRGETAPGEGSFQKAGEDLAAYILSKPTNDDQKLIDTGITEIPRVIRDFVL